jgi:S1-C subfamily serine protease
VGRALARQTWAEAQVALGDSNQLHQGLLVMAFGNPLGLEGSASISIISSTGRQIKTDDPRMFIQTDAPINPAIAVDTPNKPCASGWT